MECATCLHLTIQITVLTVITMASVQEAVQTWAMTVSTVPALILIAIAMFVRSLLVLPIRNVVMTLHVTSALVDIATLIHFPALTQMIAAPQTQTVIILMGCATYLHHTPRITVLTVTISTVQEAVQTWAMTVPTVQALILIAIAMCVRSLLVLQMRNVVMTLNVTSALVDNATLIHFPALTQMTAAPLTLTVIIMMGCATCLHHTPRITVPTVIISTV